MIYIGQQCDECGREMIGQLLRVDEIVHVPPPLGAREDVEWVGIATKAPIPEGWVRTVTRLRCSVCVEKDGAKR